MFKRQVQANLPTKWGQFEIYAYSESFEESQPHLALVHCDTNIDETIPVRIHSECLTGDLFGSKRCDCGEQLEQSIKIIQKNGGILIYLRQEGRGIGLLNKLKAYNLQDEGLDTIEANVHLGFEADERDFEIATYILEDLGVKNIDLITNNPEKISVLNNSKINLRKRIPMVIPSTSENEKYMLVKQKSMGHLL